VNYFTASYPQPYFAEKRERRYNGGIMKNIIKTLGIPAMALVAALSVSCAVSAWTAPTGTPPSGNTAAPLNISGSPQTKSGLLKLSTVDSYTPTNLTDLRLGVNGDTGSDRYCDKNGVNCFRLTSGNSSLLDSPTSITNLTSLLTLLNGKTANKYFGTNASNVLGWYGLPAGTTDDQTNPGNYMYYGTNGSGVKGWYSLAQFYNTQINSGRYCDQSRNNCFTAADIARLKNQPSTPDVPSTPTQTLVWLEKSSYSSLCFNRETRNFSNNCQPNAGLTNRDSAGGGALGALEYCQYLNSAGTQTADSYQGLWRLPTTADFNAAKSSGSPSLGTAAMWGADGTTPIIRSANGSVGSGLGAETVRMLVRCVKN
jgi:hypothetical protein